MDKRERQAMGWMIGYFIALWPITYAMKGSLIFGLIDGIIGLGITIAILKTKEKK